MIPTNSILCIYGTGSGDFRFDDEIDPNAETTYWFRATSPWWRFMREQGFLPYRDRDFYWSGDVNGFDWQRLINPLEWFRPNRRVKRDWYAGGRALLEYCERDGNPSAPGLMVAHSHGGWVAVHAAAFGLKIPVLVTIGTPNRGDMKDVIRRARPNIQYWVHVYARDKDFVALLGQLTDGVWSLDRAIAEADRRVPLAGIDHSLLLVDPRSFHHWTETILPSARYDRRTTSTPVPPVTERRFLVDIS